jgi:hypothetical protein
MDVVHIHCKQQNTVRTRQTIESLNFEIVLFSSDFSIIIGSRQNPEENNRQESERIPEKYGQTHSARAASLIESIARAGGNVVIRDKEILIIIPCGNLPHLLNSRFAR